MEKEINLLSAAKKPIDSANYQPAAKKLTVGLIAVYVILLVGVFSFHFFYSLRGEKLAVSIEEKEAAIGKLEKVEALYLLVQKRLAVAAKVFKTEEDLPGMEAAVEGLTFFEGEKANIQSASLTNYGNEVLIKGKAPKIGLLLDFLAELDEQAEGVDTNWPVVSLSEVQKEDNGWIFSINLQAMETKSEKDRR